MTQAISTNNYFFINSTGNIFSTAPTSKRINTAKVVDQAFATFADQNPNWVGNLFDQHFIDQKVKPVVAFNNRQGRHITALDVAMLWDAQFSNQSFERRQKHMGQLVIVAESFVREMKKRLA